MATSGKRLLVKAPDKGSFPLDHQGVCKNQMRLYMKCLFANDKQNFKCRSEARDYFHCRMENNLMEKDVSIFSNLMKKDVSIFSNLMEKDVSIFSNLMEKDEWKRLGFHDLEQNEDLKSERIQR